MDKIFMWVQVGTKAIQVALASIEQARALLKSAGAGADVLAELDTLYADRIARAQAAADLPDLLDS